MDGFTTKRSTSSKDPQLRAIHFTGGKCLGERSSGSRTWTYSIEEQGGSKENSQKNTGMFVQRLKVGGKSWESTLRYQLIYTTYIYIYMGCVFFKAGNTNCRQIPPCEIPPLRFRFFFSAIRTQNLDDGNHRITTWGITCSPENPCTVYIHLHGWLILMVNAGQDTIHGFPLGMGILFIPFFGEPDCLLDRHDQWKRRCFRAGGIFKDGSSDRNNFKRSGSVHKLNNAICTLFLQGG